MFETLTFREAAVLSAVGLTLLLTALLYLPGGKRGRIDAWLRRLSPYTLLLALVLLAALALFSVSLDGPRPWLWFALQAATLVALWLVALSGRYPTAVVLASATVVLMSTIAILEAQGIAVVGNDQWRDAAAAQTIVSDGEIARAQDVMGGYYEFAPFLPILVASVSNVSGLDMFDTYFALSAVISFFGALALMLLTRRATAFAGAPVVVAVLLLSGPRLYLWQVVHSMLAIAVVAAMLMVVYRVYLEGGRLWGVGPPLTLLLMAFALTVAHPSGVIALVAFMGVATGTLVAVRLLGGDTSSYWSELRLRSLLVIITVGVVAYWLYAELLDYLTLGVFRPMWELLISPLDQPYRLPINELASSPADSLAWALPLALAVALALWAAPRILRQIRSPSVSRSLELATLVSVAASALLVGAFGVMLARGSEGGFERYISTPAYALLVLPAALAAGLIARRGWVQNVALSIALFATLVIGARATEWAPDLNPVLGYTDRDEYLIARSLTSILPDGAVVAPVKDIDSPLFSEAYLAGLEYTRPPEYFTNVTLKRNVPLALEHPPKGPNSFLIVESEWLHTVEDAAPMNILYMGGDYVVSAYAGEYTNGEGEAARDTSRKGISVATADSGTNFPRERYFSSEDRTPEAPR